MQASKRIERELGRAGLAELSTHLWAQNCQTCGLPLGSERPTLVVRSFAVTASASLHHGTCRRPGWEENPRSVFSNPPQLSRIAYALVAPFMLVDGYVRLGGGPPHGWIVPVLLVNPGIEQVPLRRIPGARRGGRWVVSTVATRVHPGLHPDVPAVVRAMQAAADAGQLALGWLGVDAASTLAESPSGERRDRDSSKIGDSRE
jgi:hypothetical protein